MERRLAAILAMDVVGYSRLMGVDEAGTLAALKRDRNELFDPKARQYRGRTVKLMGDGALMEFASAVDAVSFAVEVQWAMHERREDAPQDRQILYRIGINIGDIIIEDRDIFGDGVNIAARLEGLAQPGGICLARNVFDQVGNKLDLTFEPLGEHEVKNIADPISVYGVAFDEKAQHLVTTEEPTRGSHTKVALFVVGLLVFGISLGAVGWFRPWEARLDQASLPRPDALRPQRPSLVVLPFVNMSDDENQEYIADGIADDLTTDLSKLSGLSVISSNSAYVYKGKNITSRQIAEELSIRYILRGSVRRLNNRIIINVHLIDAGTEETVWAERYRGYFKDIFSIQESLLINIFSELASKMGLQHSKTASKIYSFDPAAYEYFLQGQRLFRTNNQLQARDAFEKAIKLDPNFARAYSALSISYTVGTMFGLSTNAKEDLAKATVLANKSVALGDAFPQTHLAQSFSYLYDRKYKLAISSAEQAAMLDPGFADAYSLLAWIYAHMGKPREALRYVEQARLFDPYLNAPSLGTLALAHFLLRNYDESIKFLRESLARNPNYIWTGRLLLIAIYVRLGQMDGARWEAAELEVSNPGFSVEHWAAMQPFKDETVLLAIQNDLRKAGLN